MRRLVNCNCNNCAFISITEEEQNRCKLKSNHRCLKYNVRLYHRRIKDSYIYPTSKCDGRSFRRRGIVK